MTHRPWSLVKRVTTLLRDGFEPWVRKSADGVEEVWARARRRGARGPYEVEEAGPVTPAEGELMSHIMHNRMRGKWKDRHEARPDRPA